MLIVSPGDFKVATKLPVILPVTNGGALEQRIGFAISLTGTKITGVVRCDQPRVLDIRAHRVRKADTTPSDLADEILARVATIFE